MNHVSKHHSVALDLTGTLENKPGCNAEQTLEALVNGELGRIRDLVGGMCDSLADIARIEQMSCFRFIVLVVQS